MNDNSGNDTQTSGGHINVGNITNSEGNAIGTGSTVNITKKVGFSAAEVAELMDKLKPEEPNPEELIQLAQKQLHNAEYDKVMNICQEILNGQNQSLYPEANLLISITQLRGENASKLKKTMLMSILVYLNEAIAHPATSATAWAIYGIIKCDYDIKLRSGDVSLDLPYIKQELQNAGIENIDFKLLDLVNSTSSALEKLGLPNNQV